MTPDQVIAKDSFAAFKLSNYPKLSDDDAFEIFAAELATRSYGTSTVDLERGIVAGKNDGGIDSIHIFLNGRELVDTDSIRVTKKRGALDGILPGVALDVVLTQAKNQLSWDTNVFPKIQSVLELALKGTVSASDLRAFPLNDDVVEKALLLKDLRTRLSPSVPVMKFWVQYISFAPQGDIDAYMETKRSQLEEFLTDRLPTGSTAIVEYVGDAEVVTRLRISTDFTAELVLSRPAVREKKALVGLVKVSDYLNFLRRDGSAAIRDELFAVNVRDYAGSDVRVNGAIAQTLEVDSDTEFWWLNNGITVLADAASDPIELHWVATNPLIVNGLQTSHVIHDQDARGKITPDRMQETVLVRLIIESDPVVRESIIRGTNNQTAIASIQLHANEEKQLRIEAYLRSSNWYYERRRYQFRGATVPAGRTKTISEVAQAVLAYRLLEPETARARPGSTLNSSSGWSRVFNDSESEDLYLKALNVVQGVDDYLRTAAAKAISDSPTNSRYYLVSGYAIRSSRVKSLKSFSSIPSSSLKSNPAQATLAQLHKLLHAEANKLDDGKTARDRIFKGAKLAPAFLGEVVRLNGGK